MGASQKTWKEPDAEECTGRDFMCVKCAEEAEWASREQASGFQGWAVGVETRCELGWGKLLR